MRTGSFPGKRHLLLAAVLGAGVVALPAVASSETTQTVSAEAGSYGSGFRWAPSQVEVGAGGTVAFQNASTNVEHGVEWTGSPPETPSCPGVPIDQGKTSWKGTCTFTHPGTYSFRCVVHPMEMTGTIVVNANGTTTTTTPTATTTPTTPTTTTPSPSPESPLAGSVSQALKLAKSQHGGSVRGSIDLSPTGAGDRLEIDVFAQSASLAKVKHTARVRVGRLIRSSVSAGRLSFSVKLNAKARRALKRHGRLALTVKIMLTPTSGEPFSVTRAVVEHA